MFGLLAFVASTLAVELISAPAWRPERVECSESFNNTCKFHAGDVWVGRYGKTNTDVSLSQNEVTFTFATHNYVIETNRLGTNWNRWVITDNYLALQQFAAWPARVARDCAVDNLAKYTLKFSADCQTAEIVAIKETCRRREALYNTMQFSLVKPAVVSAPACDMADGSGIWQAKYTARVSQLTAQYEVGTFTFAAANGAVVESSNEAVFFYRFHATGANRFLVADYGSQDLEQRCDVFTKPTLTQPKPVPIESAYTVTFASDCSMARLTTASDACVSRKRRLDGLELYRVPLVHNATSPTPSDADRLRSCTSACRSRLDDKTDIFNCSLRCQAMR